MVGVLGSPSLDHQLQQAVVQLLALGMEQMQGYLAALAAALAGSGGCSGQVPPDHQTHPVPGKDQMGIYKIYMAAVQELLKRHGGRLLAGGDPATALQLVAMLRGMAAAQLAQQQVRSNPVPPQCPHNAYKTNHSTTH